jgi:DNA-directed RNA polymerase subunit RPC12/RpoP
MLEDYRIINPPRGEPRSLGDVGVRVRIRLSGFPSRQWSHDLGARLTRELVGHPSTAHLRVNVEDLVQGDEIVLDGVEDQDAPGLANAIRCAVDAANRAHAADADRPPNLTQGEADVVASHIPLKASEEASSGAVANDPPCPRCGEAVSLTTGDREAGDQIAAGEIDCPHCGARLIRDVQGHADRGWRLAD